MRSLNHPLNVKTLAVILISLGVILMLSAASCEADKPASRETESKNRSGGYDYLVKNQPAKTMTYSPTRETKNFWIETWNEKGKLSYVYLMNSTGEVFGYFILQGLPVSYCTSLVPPEEKTNADLGQYDGDMLVPGASMDGTFSSGANCSTYYGKDAVSGAYVEYTSGMGINALLFDAPMPRYGDAKPMGTATIDKVN